MLLSAGCILSLSAVTACGGTETSNTVSGESTTLVTNKAPKDLTPENVIYAFLQKQAELTSYKITTEGAAVASLAGYRQDIRSYTFKNGDDYLSQAESDSFLVNMKHQSFAKGGKIVYRDSFDGEMNVASKDDYKKVYGVTADDITLGGFIINARTLRYAALEEESADTLTYYFRLAGDQSLDNGSTMESATTGVRLQARAYGSLDNLPAYSDVDMRLTIKKDWTPVSYSSVCSYECKKVFYMSVEQTLTSTYSEINKAVEIPNVKEFNEKLGSTPSEIKPSTGETDPLMQLATAFGNSLDEENSLFLPVSIDINAFGAPVSLNGDLKLKLRESALSNGEYFDALSLRFDLDISEIPLLSNIADTLTVRYPGDGLLLLMLNNRASGTDNYLFTYSVDLKDKLPVLGNGNFSLEQLQNVMRENVDLEKTGSGYKLSFKSAIIEGLNEAYDGLLTKVEERLGNTGFVRSLLGTTFTGISFGLNGTEKLSAISVNVEGTYAENTTKGRKIGVSLGVGLLETSGLISGAFEGTLMFRLEPSVFWTGNLFGIAVCSLHLDLSPLQPALELFGAFGSMMSLPDYISPALSSLDLYYEGDGVLTLVLNNQENDPLLATQIDLMQLLSQNAMAEGESMPIPQFGLEVKENGILFSLGDPLVQALDAAYQELVKTAVDYVVASAGSLGELAGQLIGSWIGASIKGAELFLGSDQDGNFMIDMAIKGIPQMGTDEIRLLSLTLTHLGTLEEEERSTLLANRELVETLMKNAELAAEYSAKIAELAENPVFTEEGSAAYRENVNKLKAELDALPDEVKSLVTGKNNLEEKEYDGETLPLLLLIQKFYAERVSEFKALLPQGDKYENYSEKDWTKLNSLYETEDYSHQSLGVIVPAVKDNPAMQEAIGEDRIKAYLEAKDRHETDKAETLLGEIKDAKAKYADAEDRSELTEALTNLLTDLKPRYTALLTEKQAIVTETYNGYLEFICKKNLEAVKKEYTTIKSDLEELVSKGEDATMDDLLGLVRRIASAFEWSQGMDYLAKWNGDRKGWYNWLYSCPTTLKPLVDEVNALRNKLLQGTTSEKLWALKDQMENKLQELKQKLESCVSTEEETIVYNFSEIASTKEEASALLEEIRGIRYLFTRVLKPEQNTENLGEELADFAKNIRTYETELEKYLNSFEEEA